jgi:hypothetical protein
VVEQSGEGARLVFGALASKIIETQRESGYGKKGN